MKSIFMQIVFKAKTEEYKVFSQNCLTKHMFSYNVGLRIKKFKRCLKTFCQAPGSNESDYDKIDLKP
jgi:hypothetical protein